MPNYLGTASGLTPTTLLLQGLNQVEDPIVATALLQIQNWANSFYTFNFVPMAGSSYTTGGVTVDFPNPFANTVEAIVAGTLGGTGGEYAQVASLVTSGSAVTGAGIRVYTAGGSQLGAGLPYQFTVIAIGH